MSTQAPVLGVDVGGTFTDLFLFDPQRGAFRTAKVPSNRGNEAEGFIGGLKAIGVDETLGSIVHGTTVGTNALLERKGARIGIITTQGFRDVLEMRRRDRPNTWGLWGDFTPVVDRDLRMEVRERTLADGAIETPVDLADVERATKALIAKGAAAVAIVFINAYADQRNERAALDVVRRLWPNPHVVASHQVLPEMREFERTSTTALNAYLQPVVGDYLEAIETRLARDFAAVGLLIVQSNGGIMSSGAARRLPVRTALSGPAAGVIAASAIAQNAGFGDIVTADLGGTSFDVSVVVGGRPAIAAQTTIDFGLVIRTPMIEVLTIGAGGGSIASVDRAGLLQVGPQSAGSVPGPACYGQGNTRPTLTDAHVVLGHIDAAAPMGGKLARLDLAAARAAIDTHVAQPLGIGIDAAADAIVRIADARMAGAIRLVSIERGLEPGRFTLLPFGGGGALHACAIVQSVGLARALVPRFPGITSAIGCTIADLRHDRVATLNQMLDALDADAFAARVASEQEAALAVIAEAGVAGADRETRVELDMHYVGQTHTLAVPVPPGARDRASLKLAFEATYRAAFGRLLPSPVKIVNLRTAAIGKRPPLDFALLAPPADASLDRARKPSRPVHFGGRFVSTDIWSRLDLPAGAIVSGPAILEQPDATIVVEPGFHARIDAFGNAIIERSGS